MSEHLAALRRMAGANDSAQPGHSTLLSSNIFSLLERTEYRRCESGQELEDVSRLRYRSYRSTNMVGQTAEASVGDALDEEPNCFIFGVYLDGALISTLRLHHVAEEGDRSPSMMVFGDVLRPMMAEGSTFVDPSRFAADPEWSRIYPQIPYLTLRLASIACFHFGAPYCLATIREEHSAFYRRVFSAQKLEGPRIYPGISGSVLLYMANVLAIRDLFFARFPFFRASSLEQRLLFSTPEAGFPVPLNVLPTAKYFRQSA